MPLPTELLKVSDETINIRHRRSLFDDQIDCLYPEDCFYEDSVCVFISDCIHKGGVVIHMAEHSPLHLKSDSSRLESKELKNIIGYLTNYDGWVYSFAMWSENDDWFLLSDQLAECFVLSTTKLVWKKIYGTNYKLELRYRYSDFVDFVSKVWVGLTDTEKQKILAKYCLLVEEDCS